MPEPVKLDANDCELLVKTLNALPAVGGPWGGDDKAIWRIRDAIEVCPEGVILVPAGGRAHIAYYGED